MVITEGPNFKDAKDSIVAALKSANASFDAGKDVFLTDKAPRDCAALATQLRGGAYTTIYFLGQPAFFAQCVERRRLPARPTRASARRSASTRSRTWPAAAPAVSTRATSCTRPPD